MEVKDARGKVIKIGSYIRYTGTGTIGEVVDLKAMDDEYWIKIKDPNLWYYYELVEVVDPKDIKDIKDSKNRRDLDVGDVKDLSDDFNDVNLTSGGAEGGG